MVRSSRCSASRVPWRVLVEELLRAVDPGGSQCTEQFAGDVPLQAPPNFVVALVFCTGVARHTFSPRHQTGEPLAPVRPQGSSIALPAVPAGCCACDGLPVKPTDQWCRRTECDRDGGDATLSCISLGIYARFAACTVGSRMGCASWSVGCLTGVCEIVQGWRLIGSVRIHGNLRGPAPRFPSKDLADPRGLLGKRVEEREIPSPPSILAGCRLLCDRLVAVFPECRNLRHLCGEKAARSFCPVRAEGGSNRGYLIVRG